jgi:hypothetical protein
MFIKLDQTRVLCDSMRVVKYRRHERGGSGIKFYFGPYQLHNRAIDRAYIGFQQATFLSSPKPPLPLRQTLHIKLLANAFEHSDCLHCIYNE